VLCGPAWPADDNGLFSIRGAGLLTCEIYASERDQRSSAYLVIGGWIDGYITGLNQYSAGTYDITSFESTELLSAVIDTHCRDNPGDRVFSVINSIVAQIRGDKIDASSPTVPIEVGGREIRLYGATVEKLQMALREQGFFEGEAASGQWDDATRSALQGFQRSAELEPTGFPDQTTLWRLLRVE
jgi:hypothetical protein